ncbi:NusA-like transcription termination signal-binding factor [Candidatus Woesearchaeota archaeon]|nr:NusA-like transcription termination signal-binding factor [Candidatus Woesearchaeota archaeon]
MVRITFSKDIMSFMTFFESMTRVPLKDCLVDGNSQLVFVVEQGTIGKAIGKKGANARRLEKALNRKIKIVEFNPLPEEFAKNLISPLKAEISEEEGVLIMKCNDGTTRSLLIGRGAKNLKNYESILRRHFDKTLKVA